MSQTASRILERGFTAVVLLLGVVAAGFAARGVSAIAAATLTPSLADLATAPLQAPRLVGVTSSTTSSAEAILARNPFDSVTGSLVRHDPAPGDDAADDVPIDPATAPRCDALVVHAIVSAEDEAASFASFSTQAEPHAVLRARGGSVGAKVVRFVGRDRVWLSDGAGYRGLCQVALFRSAPPPGPSAATAAPLPVTAPVRGASLDPIIAKGIETVSPTERRIDRGVFEKILADHAELTRGTGVIPVRENGNVVGLKISGVRPDGLLAKLGIENGDRLTTLNGFDVADPEKLLNAYAQLRTAPKVVAVVIRGGRTMQLDYVLR